MADGDRVAFGWIVIDRDAQSSEANIHWLRSAKIEILGAVMKSGIIVPLRQAQRLDGCHLFPVIARNAPIRHIIAPPQSDNNFNRWTYAMPACALTKPSSRIG